MRPSKAYFLANCDRHAIGRVLADLDRRRGQFVGIVRLKDGRETVKTLELPPARRL